MNQEEILNMPAGQDMDLLIAEKVLNLDSVGWNERFFHNRAKFSTDIRAAWEVWDKLVEQERYPTLHEGLNDNGEPRVWVSLVNPVLDCKGEDDVPLAICRAALLAVMPNIGGV